MSGSQNTTGMRGTENLTTWRTCKFRSCLSCPADFSSTMAGPCLFSATPIFPPSRETELLRFTLRAFLGFLCSLAKQNKSQRIHSQRQIECMKKATLRPWCNRMQIPNNKNRRISTFFVSWAPSWCPMWLKFSLFRVLIASIIFLSNSSNSIFFNKSLFCLCSNSSWAFPSYTIRDGIFLKLGNTLCKQMQMTDARSNPHNHYSHTSL